MPKRSPASFPGVYAIVNIADGKRCVGSSSVSMSGRWSGHRRELSRQTHGNYHLQRAWNKYGQDAFRFDVVEACAPAECERREQAVIDSFPPGALYNVCPVAGSALGRKHRPEVRALLADVLRRARKLSEKPRTADARANMSRAQQRVVKSQAEIERIRALGRSRLGVKLPPEVGQKIRARLAGRKQPTTIVEKIAAHHRQPHMRQFFSDTTKAHWAAGCGPASPEARAKKSALRKAAWARGLYDDLLKSRGPDGRWRKVARAEAIIG